MKKNIFKKVIAFGSPLFLATPFLATSSAGLENNTKVGVIKDDGQENKIFSYDNKIFNSEDQLLKYYLSTHPNAISNKNVIGNIDNATIDYDDGILNQHKLYSYDLSKINPVYRKSNGEKISSFEDAKASYANLVMIKKMFQGVTRLFPDENEAKTQRDNLIKPINMVYYDNVPNPLKGEPSLKINPLNKDDVSNYRKKFCDILNDKNYKRVNSNYRRSFEFDTSKMNKNLKSLFEKTDQPLYFINKFHKAIEDTVKDDGEFVEIEEDMDQNTSHWINRKSIPNETDEVKVDGEADKDAHMDDTVDDISIKLFGGNIDFENYLKFYKATNAGDDDSMNGYTNVNIKNEGKKNNKNYSFKDNEIDSLINVKNFQNQYGYIRISSKKGNNWVVNANNNNVFKEFMNKGIKTLKKLRDLFGNQFIATINVELIKDSDSSFKGLHVKLNDDAETGYDNNNSFWILGVNLNKFKFSWNFRLKTSLFKNLIPKLKKQIEAEDNYWKDSLSKRIFELINNIKGKEINDYDINALKKLLNNSGKIKNILENPKEYINFYNSDNKSTKKIFSVINRNAPNEKIKINNVFTKGDFDKILINDKIIDSDSEEYSLKTLVNFLLKGKNMSLEQLKKLIDNISSSNFTYEEGDNDLTGDKKTIYTLSQDHIIPTFIQQVVNHIKAIKSELSNIEDLKDNVFLKKAVLDFNDGDIEPLLFRNESKKFKFPFTIKNGAYILISDALFNGSIINKTGDGNINQDGILDTQQELENKKKIILSSRPPVVRVMYNLNGDIILGKTDPQKALLYDSQSMVLNEAKAIATPLRDHKYIFYQNNKNQEKLLLNKISNVYVLNYKGISHYFLSHNHLIKYLKHKLLEDDDINVYSIT